MPRGLWRRQSDPRSWVVTCVVPRPRRKCACHSLRLTRVLAVLPGLSGQLGPPGKPGQPGQPGTGPQTPRPALTVHPFNSGQTCAFSPAACARDPVVCALDPSFFFPSSLFIFKRFLPSLLFLCPLGLRLLWNLFEFSACWCLVSCCLCYGALVVLYGGCIASKNDATFL